MLCKVGEYCLIAKWAKTNYIFLANPGLLLPSPKDISAKMQVFLGRLPIVRQKQFLWVSAICSGNINKTHWWRKAQSIFRQIILFTYIREEASFFIFLSTVIGRGGGLSQLISQLGERQKSWSSVWKHVLFWDSRYVH